MTDRISQHSKLRAIDELEAFGLEHCYFTSDGLLEIILSRADTIQRVRLGDRLQNGAGVGHDDEVLRGVALIAARPLISRQSPLRAARRDPEA